MLNTSQKVIFNSRNNITSVNSVVYAQNWAWHRKRAHKIGSRSRNKRTKGPVAHLRGF